MLATYSCYDAPLTTVCVWFPRFAGQIWRKQKRNSAKEKLGSVLVPHGAKCQRRKLSTSCLGDNQKERQQENNKQILDVYAMVEAVNAEFWCNYSSVLFVNCFCMHNQWSLCWELKSAIDPLNFLTSWLDKSAVNFQFNIWTCSLELLAFNYWKRLALVLSL